MGTRRNISAGLALALLVQLPGEAQAEGVTTYVESSGTEQKPRSNAGLSLQGDRMRLRAGLALQGAASPTRAAQGRPTGRTEVVPSLRSGFTLAQNFDIETRVRFAEWNADGDSTFDTRLRYRRPLHTFFDELDGSLWRSHDGLTKQVLRLAFDQLLGDADAPSPLTIAGEAVFEATQNAASTPAGAPTDSRRVGLETRVTGLWSPFLLADHALSFKVEKTVGTRPESASTLAYDQSWTLGPLLDLGFNLKFLRRTHSPADDFEPSLNVSWQSRF